MSDRKSKAGQVTIELKPPIPPHLPLGARRHMGNPRIGVRYCMTCKERCLPYRGRCMWCDTVVGR